MKRNPTSQRGAAPESSRVSDTARMLIGSPLPVPLRASNAFGQAPSCPQTGGTHCLRPPPDVIPTGCKSRCYKKKKSKNGALATPPAGPGGARTPLREEPPCLCDALPLLRSLGRRLGPKLKGQAGGSDLQNCDTPEPTNASPGDESGRNVAPTSSVQRPDAIQDGRQNHLPRSGGRK
jgi:hypothetical protein